MPACSLLFRAGNTNATLNVWFDLSGTASNGVDYAAISNHLVEIPAGVTSNTVVITPLASTPSSVAKTVVLTLTNSPLMTPVNYAIGSPSSAMIYIADSGATNLPPSVSIIRTEGWRRVLHANEHPDSGESQRPGRFRHQRRIFRRRNRSRFWNARCAGSARRQRRDWPGLFVQLAQSAGCWQCSSDRRWLRTTAACPPLLRRSTSPFCKVRGGNIYRPTNGATSSRQLTFPFTQQPAPATGSLRLNFLPTTRTSVLVFWTVA